MTMPFPVFPFRCRPTEIFLNFTPHLHAVVPDGCFSKDVDFHIGSDFVLKDLEKVFRHEVLKMLKKEGNITDAVIENMLSWCHSGFHVYIGDRIYASDQTSLGNLVRHVVRACFSKERRIYIPAEKSDDNTPKVIYTSKDKKSQKVFIVLDWLATHISNRYE